MLRTIRRWNSFAIAANSGDSGESSFPAGSAIRYSVPDCRRKISRSSASGRERHDGNRGTR
ncbi:MAG TPA: hypothetical protein DEH11_09775 [Actinobacteria bacterium]|nr:hypothetical protein [Actinomycetota bacterium]